MPAGAGGGSQREHFWDHAYVYMYINISMYINVRICLLVSKNLKYDNELRIRIIDIDILELFYSLLIIPACSPECARSVKIARNAIPDCAGHTE